MSLFEESEVKKYTEIIIVYTVEDSENIQHEMGSRKKKIHFKLQKPTGERRSK